MKFEHFLITKVNLDYFERSKLKGIKPELWLEKRLKLFYKYCIPSISAQSSNNFTWLLYLDDRTPKKIKDSLIINLAGFKKVKLLFKHGDFDSLSTYVVDDIRFLISNHTTHLITSRIDTDDLVHRDYILNIQNLFTGQDYEAINFDLGYMYHDIKGVVGITKHECNPFITLIEKINDDGSFKTVRYKNHMNFCQDSRKLSINNLPIMWCMSVHDLNETTDFYAKPFICRYINLSEDFNFSFQKKAKIEDKIILFINYYKKITIVYVNKFFLYLFGKLKIM